MLGSPNRLVSLDGNAASKISQNMIIMYRDDSPTVSCREVFVKIWAFYTNDPFPGSGPGSDAGWGFHKGSNRFGRRCRYRRPTREGSPATMYRVTDRLHDGRTVDVPCGGIAGAVSAWLAELGTNTPLVEDLARAVCAGDWPAAYAIGERLSVDVTVAP